MKKIIQKILSQIELKSQIYLYGKKDTKKWKNDHQLSRNALKKNRKKEVQIQVVHARKS